MSPQEQAQKLFLEFGTTAYPIATYHFEKHNKANMAILDSKGRFEEILEHSEQSSFWLLVSIAIFNLENN